MAFTVEDFHDLVRLLEERPDWRAQLRRLVLTDELLALPGLVHELAEAQRRTEERLTVLTASVDSLAEAQRRTEEVLQALIQRVDGLEGRFDHLEGRFDHLEGRVDGLQSEFGEVRVQVDELRGESLELRYARHAGAFFGPLLRRIRVVDDEELGDLLEGGVAAGRLGAGDAREVRLADLIVRGRRPDDDQETYLVIEVSAGIGRNDVERSARRAALLGRLRPALAAVAGQRLAPEAQALAAAAGVWAVLDGRALEPAGGGSTPPAPPQ